MKNNQLIILEEAAQEIFEAFHWYEAKKVGLGEQFLEAIENFFMLLIVILILIK